MAGVIINDLTTNYKISRYLSGSTGNAPRQENKKFKNNNFISFNQLCIQNYEANLEN